MTVSHLKELFISVVILGSDFDESIIRLRKMIDGSFLEVEEENEEDEDDDE